MAVAYTEFHQDFQFGLISLVYEFFRVFTEAKQFFRGGAENRVTQHLFRWRENSAFSNEYAVMLPGYRHQRAIGTA